MARLCRCYRGQNSFTRRQLRFLHEARQKGSGFEKNLKDRNEAGLEALSPKSYVHGPGLIEASEMLL